MIRKIKFNEMRNANYLREGFNIKVKSGEDYCFIKPNTISTYVPELKMGEEYAEMILDKDDNLITIPSEVRMGLRSNKFAAIQCYEAVLKKSIGGYYILAKYDGSEIVYYNYVITGFETHLCDDCFNPIVSIDVVMDLEPFNIMSESAIKYEPSVSKTQKVYYNILKLVLDSKIYGLEYVAKGLDTLVYSNESEYMNTLLQCNSGKPVHVLNGDICICKNKNCILEDIVIINDTIYNMIDERKVYLTASIDLENKLLSIIYEIDGAKYVDDIDVIIDCEYDKDARIILERYIDASICKERLRG